jgi:hypothetical protein
MAACAFSKRVTSELWPNSEIAGAGIWALLDAAADERILDALENASLNHCSLFSGRLDPELKSAAPYLVKLRFGHAFTEYVISEGWDHHWGVFLRADTSQDELRLHLKQFLRVKDEDGHRLLFRFYDPRILRVYLPTCTAHELDVFFGPVTRFVMEDEEPARLREFAWQDQNLHSRVVELSADDLAGSAAKYRRSALA